MLEESNILVVIRVRPLNQKEILSEEFEIVRIEDNLIIILDPVAVEFQAENKKMLDVYHRSKEQYYTFDRVFRDESQEEIFTQTCKSLIKPVLNGYNATVFAYGPTGTGKTYTMLGYQDVMGLSVLTVQDFFETIQKDEENEYQVIINYVEIYNESIRDLLVHQSSYLELRDDPIKGVTIAGVTEQKATSTSQVMNLLFSGNKRRTTETTNANQTSSRSHAVFQILVTARSKVKNTDMETLCGKLSLIDLAGSERGTVTENRGIRLREGAKINRSLLALANCINALGDKSKKGFFVPYRDSKLTRLLKDSLGGNCKTVMIANVSPASSQFEETVNTLKYANRAKNIKTKQIPNKKLVAMHIAEYKNIITDLRQEIESLKARLYEKIPLTDEIEEPTINNYVGKKSAQNNQVCSQCNRQEDLEEMKKIQETIFENFQERIQLRRALMEIEEQNAMNFLEIKKKQAEILLWKKNSNNINQQDDRKPMPEEIKVAIRSIQTLKTSSDKNMLKKELMGLQLIENINNAKKIREEIPKHIKSKEKRDFLELEIKNHVLELQNIELEITLQIQEKTINDLKNITDNQKKIIQDQQAQINELTGQNSINNSEAEDNVFGKDDEMDLEYLEDLINDQEPEELNDEDDDDLENFKEMIEKQKQSQLKQQSPVNIPQQQQGSMKQRDKSAPYKKPKEQRINPKVQQSVQNSEDLMINGVTLIEKDETDESMGQLQIPIQQKKPREDSRPRQSKGNGQNTVVSQNLNLIITNQQKENITKLPPALQPSVQNTQSANNRNSNNIMPPLPKLPIQQQQQSQQQQQDLSGLNLKGKNMILNSSGSTKKKK